MQAATGTNISTIQKRYGNEMPDKNRVDQEVQFCYEPRMVAKITEWDEKNNYWLGRVIVPYEDKVARMAFPEELLAYMDAQQASEGSSE